MNDQGREESIALVLFVLSMAFLGGVAYGLYHFLVAAGQNGRVLGG